MWPPPPPTPPHTPHAFQPPTPPWLWYGWVTVKCGWLTDIWVLDSSLTVIWVADWYVCAIVMCACDYDMGGWLWCVCDRDVCVWLWYGWLTVMCVCDCDMCVTVICVCDCDMCVTVIYVCLTVICVCDCDMGGWLCYGRLWYRCLRYNHLTVTEVFNSACSNYSKPRSIPSPSLTQESCCYNDERWKRASRWELNPESSDQDSSALPLSHIPTLKEFMSVVTLAWVSLPPLCCCSNMQEICGPVWETCRCQVTAKHAVHPWPSSNHSTITGLCYS